MLTRPLLEPELRPLVRQVAEAYARAPAPAPDSSRPLTVHRWRLERAVGDLRYLAWLDPPDSEDLGRWAGRDTLVGVRFDPAGALAFCAGRGWIRLGRHVSERNPDFVREEFAEIEEHLADLRSEALGEDQP